MSETFVKIFSTILDSSIWQEDDHTRLVWVTLLAMADRNGYIGAAVPGVAKRAGVPLESAERALAKFMAPDPYSRSSEHEGRRIAKVERGWQLLNYAKFREARDQDARREQYRDSKRRSREKSAKRKEVERFDATTGNLAPDFVYDELDKEACDAGR